MLAELFPWMPVEHESEAMRIYDAIFGDLPLDVWTRQDTLITRFVNNRKLNFAARRSHCTIGFCGYNAVEFYRLIGGDCPTGEVTIKPPYYKTWDPAPIADTIDWYFNN
jgi:hypothetical protein